MAHRYVEDTIMKRYGLLVALVMGVAGCEQPTTTQPFTVPMGITPGTRLSPKLLLADDGTIFLHPTIWKDSEFGECEFRTAEDGSLRCLPIAPTQLNNVYLDPSCAIRAFVYHPETCQAPKDNVFLAVDGPGTCGDDVRWSLCKTTGQTSQGQTYIKNASKQCVPDILYPTSTDGILYVIGDVVDVSVFVSAVY